MANKNPYDNWEFSFKILRKPSSSWNVASAITVSIVGILSKVYITLFNNYNFINVEKFNNILNKRPADVPLLTVSNHISCFDDPGLWGALKLSILTNAQQMRWSLAAQDICYTKKLHGYFFLLGKSIPLVRGNGVYQAAMDFCVERLQKGEWVHIFPEGKVNMAKDFARLKWGLGRLIYEPPVTPIVVPIWHVGMDDALPNQEPYILTTRNNLTFNFGEPLDLSDLVYKLKNKKLISSVAHKIICDRVQTELTKLKLQTYTRHDDHFGTAQKC